MAKNLKRMLSLILAISMVMSLMSVGAFAEERQPLCGKTAHTHVLEAQVEGTCACGKTEDLICTLEPHTHDACTLACEKQYDLICGKEPHSHSEDCLHKCTDTCTVVTCEKIGTYVCADPHHTNECTHKCTSECPEGCEKIGINECNIEQHDHLDTCEKHACDGSCNNVPCSLIGTNGCAFEEEHIHIAYGEENSCYVAHIHDGDCYDCGKKAHAHIALGETDSCYIIHACNEVCFAETCGFAEEHVHDYHCYQITGNITDDTEWTDGDIIGAVKISGGTASDPITITVNGTVTVDGQITLDRSDSCHVVFTGDGTLIRGEHNTGGAMIWSEGSYRVYHNLLINGITLDGGAVWTGDIHDTLNRSTTNSGIKATGSNAAILFLRYTDVTLDDVVLQNQDNSNAKGCAINLGYSNLVLNETTVRNNYHKGDRGGAIYMRNGATLKAEGSTFYGNHADEGAVVGTSGSSAYASVMDFTDCTFYDNYSNGNGAVFHTQDNKNFGHLKITECTITGNSCNNKENGIIHSSSYEVPVYIEDCTITDNNCNLFGYTSNLNKNLFVSNSTITTAYEGTLSQVPFQITGSVDDMPLNEATVKHLMDKYGYIATEAGYTITDADVAKMLGEGVSYNKADVNGDGTLDIVATVGDTSSQVSVTVYDNFPDSNASETQTVSSNQYPTCNFTHSGYVFNAWIDENGAALAAGSISDGTELYAQWKVAKPRGIIVDAEPTTVKGDDAYELSISEIANYSESVSYTYQWYFDESKIPDATDKTYTTSGTGLGVHHYTCKVWAHQEGFVSSDAGVSNSVRVNVLPVARIGTTKYMTLKAAVEAANAMETPATITMLANVDLGEKLNITNDVTIEGDYTITRADTYTGTFFEVSEGAALTLDDGLTLDGGNNWSYNGTPELKAGGDTYMTDHVNPEEGGIDATAYMIVNYGTLNANDVTIQNNYSTHEAGVIQARTNSVITIDGALIQHIASNNAGTVVQIGRNNTTSNNTALTIKGDTRITDNMGAYNGGIIMMHSHNNTFNFEGGSIDNNYVVASGTVIMSYGHWDVPGARHKVNMSGGIITENEAEGYGSMYIHTRTDFVMTGGEISDNISYYPNYVRSNNTATISGGLMVGNTLTTTYSLTQFASASPTSITGGIYTQNVSSYCAPGYVCIPYDQDMSAYCDLSYAPAGYDEDTRNDDYIVTPGYKVSYYEVGTKDVTNAETVTTYLDAEFLLIPKGKMHDEVVLYATPYYHFNSDNTQAINKWFTDVELTAEFDYDTEVEANLKLYGNTWEAVSFVAKIVETGKQYETLAEAVAAANASEGADTIEMLKDIDFDSTTALSIAGDVTIIGEYTISRGDYTGTFFTVPADSSLILDGGLTIDGNNNWTLNEEAYNAALKDESIVQSVSTFVTAENNAPVADAPLFVVNGSVTANAVTIQNNLSTGSDNGGKYAIFQVNSGASLTMEGATITHVATGGANSVAHLSSGAEWHIKDGTLISDNFAGRNGGLCRNDSGEIYMSGGIIKDNHAVNTSGHVFMMYGAGSLFEMRGGTICNNSSLPGTDNEIRTAAIYLHSKSKMVMYDGTICHNSGAQCGGIVSKRNAGSELTIYNGIFTDNVSTFGDETHDIQTNENAAAISGGIYTQDVSEYCAPGYICIPYINTERTDDFIVVPGSHVTVTVNDITYVDGNPVPTNYNYTADVDGLDIDITYTVEGDVINATVAKIDGYAVTVVPGKLIKKEAVAEARGIYYASIQDAINASKKVPTTVTVLKDHTVDVNTRTYGYPILLNGHDITLDLNGKVVTFDYSVWEGSAVYASIRTANGAKLKILDSSAEKTGTLYNKETITTTPGDDKNSRIIWLTTGCELEIESGRFINDQYNTMFYASNTNTEVPVNFFVRGGYFEQIGVTQENHHDCFNREDVPGPEYIELTGGTYAFEDPRLGRQNDWEITIPEGYTVIDNKNNTWSVNPYITVTFHDQNMVVGNPVPELTYTIDYNYLGKEVVGVNVEVTTITNPQVGEHIITGTATLTDGTGKAENYAVKIVDGKLTVTAPQNNPVSTYTVNYEWSGLPSSANKTLPTDSKVYSEGDTVIVDSNYTNTSTVKVGHDTYIFSGWNTGSLVDGKMPASNVTISGSWHKLGSDPTFTVVYSWTGLPSSANKTLPTDSKAYYEGDTVIVDTSNKAGDTVKIGRDTFTFRGWDKNNFTMGTQNVTISGIWDLTDHELNRRPDNEEDTTETDETIEIADQIALAIPSVFSTDHYAYIVGYDDGTVRPTANITRAEVATIFFRLLTDEVRSMAMTRENNFSDVKAGDWYNTAVSTMAAMGIINGYPDGTFRPNAYITRAEFSAIAARFDVDGEKGDISFTDVIGHWAENEIGVAAYNGWIKGYEDNTFRPDRNINRAEAMTLVNRVLARNPEAVADLLDGMRVWTDNADPKQWYYLAIQEATNSHDYERKEQGTEYWTELVEDRDWATLED